MLQVFLLCFLLGSANSFTVSRQGIFDKNEESSSMDDFSISAHLEKANKNLGKRPTGPMIRELDIAVGHELQNADPCTADDCKWPKSADGKVYVPYSISNDYSYDDKLKIRGAMRTFAKSTCVQFIPRNLHKDFLDIVSDKGCHSLIGKQTGAQVVSLARDGCMFNNIIQRELLHALGFQNEHSRSDRDQHVKIMWENIQPGEADQFKIINTNNLDTPYDYGSVMQFGKYFFSKKPDSPTIVPIPNANVKIGMAKEMSENDIERVRRLYC